MRSAEVAGAFLAAAWGRRALGTNTAWVSNLGLKQRLKTWIWIPVEALNKPSNSCCPAEIFFYLFCIFIWFSSLRLWPKLGSVLITFTIFPGEKHPKIPDLCSWSLSSFAEQSGVAVPGCAAEGKHQNPGGFSLSLPTAGAEAGAGIFFQRHREVGRISRGTLASHRCSSPFSGYFLVFLGWIFCIFWYLWGVLGFFFFYFYFLVMSEWESCSSESEFPVLPKAFSITSWWQQSPFHQILAWIKSWNQGWSSHWAHKVFK